MKPVFLSASLPDPKRHEKYYSTADLMAIRDCVRALATVVLPKALLVFGGHPAITPLIRRVGQRLDRMSSIRMFQSALFAPSFPPDNEAFAEVVITKAIGVDREASLRLMRETMIRSQDFGAGVFIGGMEGVEEEFALFRSEHPKAGVFPVASTGAAARIVYSSLPPSSSLSLLTTSRVYSAMFTELLVARPIERRTTGAKRPRRTPKGPKR